MKSSIYTGLHIYINSEVIIVYHPLLVFINYGNTLVSELTILLISMPIMSISFCIINDGLEWKEDIKIGLLLGKSALYTLVLGFFSYPFAISFVKDGVSYKDLAVTYTFGFGLAVPMIGKIIDLIYIKFIKSNTGN
jgi:hypothetical protein